MIVCAAGDAHGALDRLYDDVLAFESALEVTFDWVLHVGDFGIWPDVRRVDQATRRHDGAGDFRRWVANGIAAPRRTVFIKGNHEDFEWLDAQKKREVHPGLFYLPNGDVFDVVAREETLRVGGIGGCFGPSSYERAAGHAKRHYTRVEIETLCTHRDLDIVLTHDAPAGARFPRHRQGEGFISVAAGLDWLLERTRPRVCLFGHHHVRVDAHVAGIPCIGLNTRRGQRERTPDVRSRAKRPRRGAVHARKNPFELATLLSRPRAPLGARADEAWLGALRTSSSLQEAPC